MRLHLGRSQLCRLATAVVAGIAWAAVAHADDHPPQLAWRCTVEPGASVNLLCVPSRANAEAVASGAADWPAEPADPRAKGDMRPVAERGGAETFSAVWRVPLHSPPTDPAFVNELMRSVLCGKHPACSVDYQAPATRLARR